MEADTAGGAVFLTDFGLAKDTVTGSKFTRTGATLGTPAYMSPEQARGDLEQLTPRSDVWALGCVLYELLVSRPAFGGDQLAAIVGQVLFDEPAAVRGQRPAVPRAAARLCATAMQKASADRPAGAIAFRTACDAVLAGHSLARPAAARRALRRRAAVVVGLTALGAAGIWAGTRDSGPDGAATAATEVAQAGAGLAEAAWAQRHRNPAASVALMRRALDRSPDRHAWRERLGLLLWAVGDLEGARAAWGRIPPDAPEHPDARLNDALSGAFRLKSDGVIGTRRALEALAELAGGTGRVARIAAAADLEAQERWGEARAKLVGLRDWRAHLLRATIERNDPKGDPERAIAAYDAALSDGIPFAWAHSDRGALRHDLGNDAGARADFDAAIRLRPGFARAWSNRGVVEMHQEAYAKAVADFTRAIQLDPSLLAAWLHRASARLSLEQFQSAESDFTQVLKLQPGHATALAGRGHAHRRRRRFGAALADYNASLQADPLEVDALVGRGTVHLEEGRPAEAVRDLAEAARLAPDDVVAQYRLGMACTAAGDPEGAERAYTALIGLEPENAETYIARGALRMERRDADGALADLDRAVAIAADSYSALVNRGEVYRRLRRDYAKAEADYRAALAARADGWEALLGLGLALMNTRRPAEALVPFRRFMETAPANPYAAHIRKWIAVCEARVAKRR